MSSTSSGARARHAVPRGWLQGGYEEGVVSCGVTPLRHDQILTTSPIHLQSASSRLQQDRPTTPLPDKPTEPPSLHPIHVKRRHRGCNVRVWRAHTVSRPSPLHMTVCSPVNLA
ncbi:hypothetical protein TcWFU_006260 [Taenia crassiceps]|uniref:Uncharacterized protein n=1 Tax=Taenia crassiceps TaxID=6207 RepID=A0ABR4Q231_9CEST